MYDLTSESTYRWQLWRRVFAFDILPPRSTLDLWLDELGDTGRRLWHSEAQPLLADAFPALFQDDLGADLAHRSMAASFRRVGAYSYQLGHLLSLAHLDDEAHADAAGRVAAWMGISGAVVDHLLDRGGVSGTELGAHLSPEAVAAALPADPNEAPHRFDTAAAPAELRFLLMVVERAFAGLRARLAAAPPSPFRDRIREEAVLCLQRMVRAELRSPMLRLSSAADLDRVEEELRAVNTLCVWVSTYVGLLGGPPPPEALLEGLLRVTTRVGELGWILDSLADAHVDLREGVWSLVWLMLAREADGAPAWLRALPADAGPALRQLAGSATLDRLLSQVEGALREIEREPALPAAVRGRLGRLCRLCAYSFLAPGCPEPEALQRDGAPAASAGPGA